MLIIFISLSLLHVCWTRIVVITVLHVNEIGNELADSSVSAAFGYLEQKTNYNIKLEVIRLSVNRTNSEETLQKLCKTYGDMLERNRPPHLILDTTKINLASETVKRFTRALALPTVAASFGEPWDTVEWRHLDSLEECYLIQVNPPADIIPDMIKYIVIRQNITSAAILHDDTFEMEYKHASLLQNIATRHIISKIQLDNIDEQLLKMRRFKLVNFFILGSLNTLKLVLDSAWKNIFFEPKYTIYAITQDLGDPQKCDVVNGTIFLARPIMNEMFKSRFDLLKKTYGLDGKPEMAASFYFDLTIQSLLTVRNMMVDTSWIGKNSTDFMTCEEYVKEKNEPPRIGRQDRFYSSFEKQLRETMETPAFGTMHFTGDQLSDYMNFEMAFNLVDFDHGNVSNMTPIGYWLSGHSTDIEIDNKKKFDTFLAVLKYRVVVAEQTPFLFRDENHPKGYNGYCMDLMDHIADLLKFEYDVVLATNNEFGFMNEEGLWNGLIKDLIDKKADIGLGPISVMEERESVIDFTLPYYDLVGITILMKIPFVSTSLFKFLTVLEDEVWFCIIAAYFFTSFLLWIFHRMSPFSFRNNPQKYEGDNDNRDFTLKECLWFCMTSLTPQGGGEAPKNLSGRLAAGAWWIFGFIIVSSYTANLAAFLTVSRLETPIESLDDLSKQYKIEYAPTNGSFTATYFMRMKNIEKTFYEIWKDMSLNTSMSNVERAQLAVWDYPVGQKYSKMWIAMTQAGFPRNLEEAVKRVKKSPSSTEGFAYVGDATDIKYLEMTNCDLKPVGEEFSRKPYALAVQEGSPLKEQIDTAILHLLNQRTLEYLKTKWWTKNPNKAVCDIQETDESDGISIRNIGGVFIVIFVGIVLSLITLVFEFWWYKCRKQPSVTALDGENHEESRGGTQELGSEISFSRSQNEIAADNSTRVFEKLN